MRYLFLFLLTTSLLAWTPTTRKYMAVTAFRAFPSDVRLALNHHRKSFLDGASMPLSGKSRNDLINEGCRLSEELAALLDSQPDFDQVAKKLGHLMAITAELSNPYLDSTSSQSSDYSTYVERKLDCFFFAGMPLNFNKIVTRDVCVRLFHVPDLGKSHLKSIEQDYRTYRNSSNFDDLSGAFGSGSLLFSDSCTEMVIITSLLWNQAAGNADDAAIFSQ
ncbi:MAG: hypothetical protein CO090_08835 [Acidobacteria bacterium CG_4_9_14_3_um_filter_49_7]|nr:MAG: hypothetical protein CO090_08835 [Acidobacteria bacterium CG_4_9_14_3_um_filter_49_7]